MSAAGSTRAGAPSHQATGTASWSAATGRRIPGRLVGVMHRHLVFAVLLAAGGALRVVATAGFQPALLVRLDSYDYLWGAVHLSPNVVNTSGYSLFLWLLRPFGSLLLVTAVQHALGLGMAVLMYRVLRRYRLPGWAAALATVPVLFDPTELVVEQYVLPDLLTAFLTVAALAVLLLETTPTWWRPAAVGLLIGASAAVRPTTLPLIILIPLYLLVRRAGWRRACAALLAGVLPVAGYMGWFLAATGSFGLSDSNGLFLWSNTLSFANCAVIKPPADLRALCPQAQPTDSSRIPAAQRQLAPMNVLWDHQAWQWQSERSDSVSTAPDTTAFNPAANGRALRFGLMAIEAQPLAYAKLVGTRLLKPFGLHRPPLRFPVYDPSSARMTGFDHQYAAGAIRAYAGNGQHVTAHLSNSVGTRVRPPFAGFIRGYQRYVWLPGPLLALVALAGLAGAVLPGRRRAAAALAWLSGLTVLLVPIATHSYAYRFALPALPLFCLAAALVFAPRRTATGGTREPAAVEPCRDG